ncbi:MAG: dihydropteroate synthase, partial [Gammaproteobacteria bacterium]|nr:dihydropteroate synthase [Gammaproteobacteria bacterium]
MITLAERINGQFLDVKKAIKEKDPTVIHELAKKQTEAGATYLDINVGTAAADQEDAMKWLVESTQEAVKTPIALDSQKLDVIKAGLEVIKNDVMINSAQGDPETLDTYMQLAKQHNAALICLTMNKDGI